MRAAVEQMNRSRRNLSECGFTLMELLVSMTIISLLAVTILFGWRIAAGAWGRASQLVDEQRRVAAIDQVLETQMAEMLPATPWLRQGNAAVFFQGEPRTARFLSRYSLVNRSRSGLYLVEYQISDGPSGTQQLLLNESPVENQDELGTLRADAPQSADSSQPRFVSFERTPQTRVMLEEITGAHFEYYQPAGPLGPGGWVSRWQGQANELPRAMAIRFSANPAPNRLQPAAVVARIEDYSRMQR